ncbi:MAG: hypothetical protein HKO57_15160, partial [Akkermansiaceae bacterium]|nr:hypothetical protein [Akkermansiaceae bacterium]
MLPAFTLGEGLVTLACAAFLTLPVAASAVHPDGAPRFAVDYSPSPALAAYEGFDHVILDPAAAVRLPKDPPPGDAGGPVYHAYLSVLEVPAGAAYAAEADRKGLLLEGVTNEVWNSTLADLANPEWEAFVVDQLAARAVEKGFRGFFLDTADSIARLPGAENPGQRGAYLDALASLVLRLHSTYPGLPIILNRGFDLVDQLPDGTLSGVLIESVYQTFDHAAKSYGPVPGNDTRALESRIASLRKRNLPVLVIDYVDPSEPELAAATAARIEALGAAALVTEPDLQGMILAPAAPVRRQILVLFGTEAGLTAEDPRWATDTEVSKFFQVPLEWMGYEVRYHHADHGRPAENPPENLAGVIVDASFVVAPPEQRWHAEWLARQVREGRKLLLAGAYPFDDSEARRTLFAALGIRGSGDPVRAAGNVRITSKDALYDFESEVRPLPIGFLDATAPEGSKVLLRLEARLPGGEKLFSDPAYLADWGGVVMNPYWKFEGSSRDGRSLLDPFAFLGAIWPAGDFPAPDPTTREGLRMYWAHVDGDAFSTLSVTRRDVTCAEVIRDRILKTYPLPVTVSVIEAEIRSIQETQDPADSERYEAIARDIFKLPHVEAASHAFTHPFVWSPEDVAERDYYDHDHLHLHTHIDYDRIDYEREIAGSVEYIERALLPEGKKVRIMLWSGNCRPFAEAIAVADRLGIENMNGGFTIYSPRHPNLSAIAPRVTWWDDRLQIYTANQNEFVYTGDWHGPFYGGFERVIDSFEMLDAPRRLKPINVYYHF